MALEPAGVDLQAKGFDKYIKNLQTIEKTQKQVFDTKFKGTDLSFQQVTKAAKDYENQLKRTNEQQKKATQESKRLAEATKIGAATQRTANIATANSAIAITKQVATAAFELGKLGAAFQAQSTGLDNLAASFGQSGKALSQSIVDASKGTISDFNSLKVANEALLLGVAKTPKEFERFTKSALILGRTVGLSATESIGKFTTALGRESLLRLDDFGAKAAEVNAEIERLARTGLGKLPDELTQVEKSAIFIEAALNVTGDSVERIGEGSSSAAENFDRMSTSAENLKTQLGLAVVDLNQAVGFTDLISKEINKLSDGIREFRGGFENATLDQQIESTELKIERLNQTLEDTRASFETGGFLAFLDAAAIKTQEKTLGELQVQLDQLNFDKAAENAERFEQNLAKTPPVIEDNTKAIKAYAQVLQQAEGLQLSFARAAEDAAIKTAQALEDGNRKSARALEDIERRRGRQIGKLDERQAKDRDELLKDQIKSFADFEEDRSSQISEAEKDISKERKRASDQRIKDQQKLQRQLAQQAERFNLSQLQSERRFQLSEKRLRADGDILGIQQLREDRELQLQENKENFDLQKKNTKSSASEQQKEQESDLNERLSTLKQNLEKQRGELLVSFDEQLAQQAQQQAEQRTQLQANFLEQDQDRAISLARQEEDREIAIQREKEATQLSQQRQLEDLGRSFSAQEEITKEGATAIAAQLETVFGQEGVADSILGGFTSRAESDFRDLFKNIEDIAIKGLSSASSSGLLAPALPTSGIQGQVPIFDDGGVVPGPIGSPQIIRAEGGETVLPTHKQSFKMPAPVIPSQRLAVEMSGGFAITGGEAAGEAATQAAVTEVVDTIEIAINRLARRN